MGSTTEVKELRAERDDARKACDAWRDWADDLLGFECDDTPHVESWLQFPPTKQPITEKQ